MKQSNKQRRPGGADAEDRGDGLSPQGDRKIGGQGDGGNYGFDRHARGIPMGAYNSSSRRGAGASHTHGGSVGAGSQPPSGEQSSGERELEPYDHSESNDRYKKSSEVVSQWCGSLRDQGKPRGRRPGPERSGGDSSPSGGSSDKGDAERTISRTK